VTPDILLQHFHTAANAQEQKLLTCFYELEAVENLFYAIIVEENGKYKFAYASRSIERLTGYPLSKFSYHEGSPFFYSITPPQYRDLVLEQEVYYLKKARQPDFNPAHPFIIEIDGALQRSDHHVLRVRMEAIVLEFTRERHPKLGINAWQIIDGLSEESLLTSRLKIESILRSLHKIHLLTTPKVQPQKYSIDDPIRLSYPLYDFDNLTKQEYRVLKLLADGLSSKEIADKLFISINTVETHRKHLLQKFKAVNMAEMIKKATKLFWLE
jgi:DNA-binding CsgD family transcriptional regulator